MSEQNKRLVLRAYEEVRSQGQLGLVDEIFAPDYVGHDPTAMPEEVQGPAGFRDQTAEYRRVFPDGTIGEKLGVNVQKLTARRLRKKN